MKKSSFSHKESKNTLPFGSSLCSRRLTAEGWKRRAYAHSGKKVELFAAPEPLIVDKKPTMKNGRFK